jgi:hypothetical protein
MEAAGSPEMLDRIFQTKGTLKMEAEDFSGRMVGTFKKNTLKMGTTGFTEMLVHTSMC